MTIGVCTKCHSLMPLTRHHIVPRSKGGNSDPANIRMACRPCHDELDIEAGVRLLKKPRAIKPIKPCARKRIPKPTCTKCGASVPKVLQLGIMQAAEASGLCQRCAWTRERQIWHELRESLERKKLPVADPPELDDTDYQEVEDKLARLRHSA